MKKLLLIALIALAGCRKIDVVPVQPIDLGKESTTTAIKSSSLINNNLNIKFATTEGAKYSVQIVPFGKEEPVIKDGFTADDTVVVKKYDLSKLAKMDYDLIFIDVKGKEQKLPLIIK